MDLKKLNIAFIWHFHQPSYQTTPDGDFLLPWVRLHASKDYLDMLHKLDKNQNIKLNFNFSPVLLGSLQKYLKGAKDLHLKLLLKDENDLDENDKIFILNNYFDLNYKNMVLKSKHFTELYNKRANAKELSSKMFSLSEYADIMALFTLLWIDESFTEDYPELKTLIDKEENYTLADRKAIYDIQLDIIGRILVEYKKYQLEGKVEVSVSPYYHPILPLLMNFKNKEIKNDTNLPNDFSKTDDAIKQIDLAIEKYIEIFDTKPKGMWLSEQCVSAECAELLSEKGFLWTVLDEGILSKSLKKEFIRDFEGNLENPFELTVNYKTKSSNPINLLFADSFFSGMLNFGYGNYDTNLAVNDLYERIKIIQSKLQSSPKNNHIITIALDGENCWETYQNDGNEFLEKLYSLIDEDESLNTVLVSEFIEKNQPVELNNLQSGSWINRNFDLWIGEPTKNLAWLYLSTVCKDFKEYQNNLDEQEKKELEDKLSFAQKEILIAQSSDWYWWYGEPNKSKNDDIFDFLFRNHLMNVYKYLSLEVPKYLQTPLSVAKTRPLRNPDGEISPTLNCLAEGADSEWKKAGFIFIPDAPTSNVIRLIKNIYFGYDKENFYLRIELNKNSTKIGYDKIENQIAIYILNEYAENFSPVRFVNKNENIYPIIRNNFSSEIRFVFNDKEVSKIFSNKALNYGLWGRSPAKNSKINYLNDIIELKISFEDLGFETGYTKEFAFCILDATDELINEVYPQDVLINLRV